MDSLIDQFQYSKIPPWLRGLHTRSKQKKSSWGLRINNSFLGLLYFSKPSCQVRILVHQNRPIRHLTHVTMFLNSWFFPFEKELRPQYTFRFRIAFLLRHMPSLFEKGCFDTDWPRIFLKFLLCFAKINVWPTKMFRQRLHLPGNWLRTLQLLAEPFKRVFKHLNIIPERKLKVYLTRDIRYYDVIVFKNLCFHPFERLGKPAF